MTSLCPVDFEPVVQTRFDVTFGQAEDEKLIFGIPGELCKKCNQLFLDPELLDLLGILNPRARFAIESDRTYRERTAAAA